MVAQSSQALPSKSHRDHPTVSWASESAKALFHETKLLLAPMKFPRPGLRWVRPEGHVFGGSKLDVLGKRLLRWAIISSTGWVGMVVFGSVCDDCTSPTRSLQHLVWQCSTCQQYSNYPATWCAAKQNLSNLLTIGILIVKWQKIDCLLPSKIIQTKNNISTPIEVSFSEGGTWIRSPEAVQQKKYPRRSPRPFWGTFWSRKRGNRSIWSTQCSIASRSTHIDTYSKTSGWFFSHLHEDLLFEAFQQVPMLNKLHDPPVARPASNRCVSYGFKPPGDHWDWRGNTSIYLALLQWCGHLRFQPSWTNSPTHTVQKATPRIPLPTPMHRSSHSTGPKQSGNTPICGRMEQSSVYSVDAAHISLRIGWKMHQNASPSPK